MMDFFESWPLFLRPYTLTLLAAAVLAMIGVVATARRQLFMAVAVAQTSLLGYAVISFLFVRTSVVRWVRGLATRW
ncbi:hypothetical protein [Mucisphaera calidilacus]|uniref:Uncharacterized protein n=1 Tax=Mucisphaera calidilacus TaxID=2527982 RepID=A0A518BXW9_9BACT|nr:hypothetical protein [Mucisphaera calidilacus]QDU71823.1 hypothetical protein Pan265_16760 [Mucisphaera calidilacus]